VPLAKELVPDHTNIAHNFRKQYISSRYITSGEKRLFETAVICPPYQKAGTMQGTAGDDMTT
jgi:hypothetical protein